MNYDMLVHATRKGQAYRDGRDDGVPPVLAGGAAV